MRLKAHVALLIVAIIYGTNYTIAKNVLDQQYLSPNGFILLRVIAGFLLFQLFHFIFIKEKVDSSDKLMLFVCSIFGVVVNQLCFFKGLSLTSPIHASMIMVLTPIIVLLISSVYLREKVGIQKVVGIMLGIIGAGILIVKGSDVGEKMASSLGDLFVLINATSYGIYLVLVKRLTQKYNPITVMKWVFSFGVLVVAPIGAKDLMDVQWSSFNNEIWIGVAYVLLCTTFLAYVLNGYALSKVTSTTASVYIYLQPLIASTIAIMFYGDQLSFIKIVCGILIFAGVYLVSFSYKKIV